MLFFDTSANTKYELPESSFSEDYIEHRIYTFPTVCKILGEKADKNA